MQLVERDSVFFTQICDAPIQRIPAHIRRRCSQTTSLALAAALEICKEKLPDYAIFASQHGEIGRSLKLLESLKKQEVLSPIAFSQSVHNTAAGLFTIINKSLLSVTSVAAGPQTENMAMLEAYAYLNENPQDFVLVVVFDQALPQIYQRGQDKQVGFAKAILLSWPLGSNGEKLVNIHIQQERNS